MWTVSGLVLVVAALLTFSSFVFSSSKYMNMGIFSDTLCMISGRTFCSEEATARASTKDMVSAINYVCGDDETPSDYINYTETCADPECLVNTRVSTLKTFYLPQGVTGLQDWVPGNGDPSFLVYYEFFPPNEDVSWASSLKFEFVSMIINGLTAGLGGNSLNALRVSKTGLSAAELSTLYDIPLSEASKMVSTISPFIQNLKSVYAIGGKFTHGEFVQAIKDCVGNAMCLESLNLGSYGVAGGAHTVDELVSSYLDKFLACDSNTICLKTPFKQPQAYGLSEKCRGKYIELEKLFDRNTRMYMASPCYAKVKVYEGECEGEVKQIDAAGWAGKITVLETSYAQPNIESHETMCTAPDGTSVPCTKLSGECATDYRQFMEGDLSPSEFDDSIQACTWTQQYMVEGEPKISKCIKVEPIGTLGEQNFCYTPAAYFTEANDLFKSAAQGGSLVCTALSVAAMTGVGAPLVPVAGACWTIDKGIAIGWAITIEASSWPHGCLKTDTPPYWTCAS